MAIVLIRFRTDIIFNKSIFLFGAHFKQLKFAITKKHKFFAKSKRKILTSSVKKK